MMSRSKHYFLIRRINNYYRRCHRCFQCNFSEFVVEQVVTLALSEMGDSANSQFEVNFVVEESHL